MKILTLLMLFFCFTGAAKAQNASIKIYPDIKHQVIQSVGGNYCQSTYTPHAADAIGNETLREFRPTHVRVALPMKLRKIPFEQYRGAAYVRQPLVVEILEELKSMKNNYGVKNFTMSVWDLPNEFIVDHSREAQRVIKPESYDEVIQMLTDFFLKAKNDYGVEVDYFSFTHAEHGARGHRLAPVEHRDVVEPEEAALEDVVPLRVALVHPPGEVDEQLVEHALQKDAIGLALLAPLDHLNST
jgi:O-glycosyl hydrolase